MKRFVGAVAVVLLAAALLAGCGGITSPDLFIVYRSGKVPGAQLTLIVNDGGVVHCDNGPPLPISDPQLIQARAIQEELKETAAKHLVLPARAGSVLSYYLRDEDGTVRFADNSAGQTAVMRRLTLLVLQLAQGVCHRPL